MRVVSSHQIISFHSVNFVASNQIEPNVKYKGEKSIVSIGVASAFSNFFVKTITKSAAKHAVIIFCSGCIVCTDCR